MKPQIVEKKWWRGHPLKGTVSRKKYPPYPFEQGFFLAPHPTLAEPLPLPMISNIVVSAYTAPVTHQD